MVRADSAYYSHTTLAAALRAKTWFSVTARLNPQITAAISAIPDSAWTPIRYPHAVWDDDEGRWISDAEVAEATITAFTSRRKADRVTCRLVVRRVKRLNPHAQSGQGELFDAYRHHAFVTNSTLPAVEADARHRDHAVIEQVIAELKAGPLAHLPSVVYGERCLAGARGDRVQPRPRRRRARRRPARHGPLGDAAHPADQRPRTRRVIRPPAHPAPARRLALGRRLANPVRRGHRPTRDSHPLTTQPSRRDQGSPEKPDRPAGRPRPSTSSGRETAKCRPHLLRRRIRAKATPRRRPASGGGLCQRSGP